MSTHSADLEEYVRHKVENGEFRSRDEFVAEAIRLYRNLEDRHELIKADIKIGLDESERGESGPLDIDDIKRELLDRLNSRERKG